MADWQVLSNCFFSGACMFRSKPLAVGQLVLNVVVLLYCLYVYPYQLLLNKRWKKHSLNTFHLIITTCLLVQQGVMLIEVVIHVQALLQDSPDWRSNRKLSPILCFIAVPLYLFAGCHLLFYAGHKYSTMVIPTKAIKQLNVNSIQMAYIVLILFAFYMALAFILTDFVEMDLSLHRILGASLFTLFMVFVIGLLEIELVKKVFNEVHILRRERTAGSHTEFLNAEAPHYRPTPVRVQHSIIQDISKTLSRIAKIKLILLISFMMMMGITALCFCIWSDLQNEKALVNYYISMAFSVAAWDANQVVLLLKKLHSSLTQIQKQNQQPKQSSGDSSATPSEWYKRPTAFETSGLQIAVATSISVI